MAGMIRGGSGRVVRKEVVMGDINATNDIGATELHFAAAAAGNANSVQKIEALISAGVCVECKGQERRNAVALGGCEWSCPCSSGASRQWG